MTSTPNIPLGTPEARVVASQGASPEIDHLIAAIDAFDTRIYPTPAKALAQAMCLLDDSLTALRQLQAKATRGKQVKKLAKKIAKGMPKGTTHAVVGKPYWHMGSYSATIHACRIIDAKVEVFRFDSDGEYGMWWPVEWDPANALKLP